MDKLQTAASRSHYFTLAKAPQNATTIVLFCEPISAHITQSCGNKLDGTEVDGYFFLTASPETPMTNAGYALWASNNIII